MLLCLTQPELESIIARGHEDVMVSDLLHATGSPF
jgi:hypothetical protein